MFHAEAVCNSASTVLQIAVDGVWLVHRNGERSHCGPSCISRSQLLQGIHNNSEAGEEAHVPLSEDNLLQWISQVSHFDDGFVAVQFFPQSKWCFTCCNLDRRISFSGIMQVANHTSAGDTGNETSGNTLQNAASMCTLLMVSP